MESGIARQAELVSSCQPRTSSTLSFPLIVQFFFFSQDQEPSLDDVIAMEGVEFVDAGDLFSSTASDVAQFGGQVFSAHSRCFDSSLLQYVFLASTNFIARIDVRA